MSTIAFDGYGIAADTRVTVGDGEIFQGHVCKILIGPHRSAVAVVGPTSDGFREAILGWLESEPWRKGGVDPQKIPGGHLEDCSWAAYWMPMSDPGAVFWMSRNMPAPLRLVGPHAIGTGREYAMAAMMLGKSAAEAVALACKLDSGSGLPLDVLYLDQTPRKVHRLKEPEQ
jgi:hypothetical protein